ncbi:MAG: protein-ADP-ribose hydrolase [Pseudobutyrivibrio sp.]|nr:protein-ADP-ribose hydrolase [Pseudobutyrivibrio sp.]
MDKIEKLQKINKLLLDDQPEYMDEAKKFAQDMSGQRRLMRSLMNLRRPGPIPRELQNLQDNYLKEEAIEKGIVHVKDLPRTHSDNRIAIWQGDITRLDAGAIVNAANSQMLGCFVPCHACIDNAIHSAAGMELREECASYMLYMSQKMGQGYEEPTGTAVLTSGYNLPAAHVIHTVGPIVYGQLTPREEKLLESCYMSCMATADENKLSSIAFCCISTGVFHFPNDRAAEIAVDTVTRYLDSHQDSNIDTVVFNVFKDLDLDIYRGLLD